MTSIAGLDLPHVPEENKLRRVLSSALKSRLGHVKPRSELDEYWNATYFGLNQVKMFQDATATNQKEILRLCSRGLLEEAYFVETAGVGYMAKMVMLAETTEERMLYALFSADEVTHLAQISRFIPTPVCSDNSFLRFLADLIESPDKTVLLFVLQVVLEGWGLNHYRSLAKNCQDPELSLMFQSFLQDESRHHATAVTLFEQTPVSTASYKIAIESLTLFLQMVQVGPIGLVMAIEQVLGHLSRPQKVQILTEIDTETHSGTRLDLLRSLMRPGAEMLVNELEERGAFQPLPPEKCV